MAYWSIEMPTLYVILPYKQLLYKRFLVYCLFLHQGQPSLQSVTHSEGEQKKERFLIKRFHVKLMRDGRWIHWLLKATLSTKTRIDVDEVYLTF